LITEHTSGFTTLERQLKQVEQQYRDPLIHRLDHPEQQQPVQELLEEETLQVLTIADGNFNLTEVTREDKKLTLLTHLDRVQEEWQDSRLVALSQIGFKWTILHFQN
jgi:hypothetical protein